MHIDYYGPAWTPNPLNYNFTIPEDCINYSSGNVPVDVARKKSWLKKNHDTVLASLMAKTLPVGWEFTIRNNAPVSLGLRLIPPLTVTTTTNGGTVTTEFSYAGENGVPTHSETSSPSTYSNYTPTNFTALSANVYSHDPLPYFHNPAGGLLTLGAFFTGTNYPGNQTNSTWGTPTAYNPDLQTVSWSATMPDFLREYQKTATIGGAEYGTPASPTDGSTPLGVALADGMAVKLTLYERVLPDPDEHLGLFWNIADPVYREGSATAYAGNARQTIKYAVVGMAMLHYDLQTLSFVFDDWKSPSELSDDVATALRIGEGFIFTGDAPETCNCLVEYIQPWFDTPALSASVTAQLAMFRPALGGTPPTAPYAWPA